MAKQKPYIVVRAADGYWLEWFSRRAEFEVNVYRLNEDGTRGDLVVELGYPKVSGIGFNDFTPEAVSIAQHELAKNEEEPSPDTSASAV